VKEVFGFSFAPWYALGLWDERYVSYSISEGGRMLSNVCIFKADLLIEGQKIRAHSFGAVATRADCRGRGYARRIIERIFAEYPDTPAYLSANPSVLDFYPRFGFARVAESRVLLKTEIDNAQSGAVPLNIDDDRLARALKRRAAYSNLLDAANTDSVQMFHLLMDYPDDIYLLPKAGVVAVAAQEGETLFLADVIAESPVTFHALRAELPFTGVTRVEFGFSPDWLDVDGPWSAKTGDDDPLFVKGLRLPANFKFPATSLT
jgi:GNAT superfamily N-acetyltransferase